MITNLRGKDNVGILNYQCGGGDSDTRVSSSPAPPHGWLPPLLCLQAVFGRGGREGGEVGASESRGPGYLYLRFYHSKCLGRRIRNGENLVGCFSAAFFKNEVKYTCLSLRKKIRRRIFKGSGSELVGACSCFKNTFPCVFILKRMVGPMRHFVRFSFLRKKYLS